MRNDLWHELNTLLPPASWRESEDAHTTGTLSGLAQHGYYNGAWQYDCIERGFGSYDMHAVPGGSLLVGSPHNDMARGDHADYTFRMSNREDGTTAYYCGGWSIDAPPGGSAAACDVLTDGTPSAGRCWRGFGSMPSRPQGKATPVLPPEAD